jgi:hypothetical protein
MLLGSYTSALPLAAASVCFPAYFTFKALQTTDAAAPAKSRWLQYWLVLALTTPVWWMLDFLSAWIPLYYEAKLAFALWLSLDRFKGATVLSSEYLEPFLLTHQSLVDDTLVLVQKKVTNLKSDDVRSMIDFCSAKVQELCGGSAMSAAATPAAVSKSAKASTEKCDKPPSPNPEDTTETHDGEAAEAAEAPEETAGEKKDK